MSKIDDIIQSGRAPGFSQGVTDMDHSAARKVPKALREVESEPIYKHGPARGASRIAKHFGMSTELIKKAWSPRTIVGLFLVAFILQAARGGDITAGYSFVDGQVVSAANFNQQVGSAVINSSYLSSKAVDTTPVSSDYFVTYSPTRLSLFRLTLSSAFLSNPNLIAAQSEKAVPVSGDFVLLYDTSGAALTKASVGNLVLGTNTFNGFPIITSPSLSAYVPLFTGGTNARSTLSNILLANTYVSPLTNAVLYEASPLTGAIVDSNRFLMYSAVSNKNVAIEAVDLLNNFPAITYANVTGNDILLLGSHGADAGARGMTLNILAQFVTNNVSLAIPFKFSTLTYALVNGGSVANTNHGFSSAPQAVRWILLCSTNDVGYVPGDEVDVSAFYNTGAASFTEFSQGVNATNVFLTEMDTTVHVHNKTNGVDSIINVLRWKAKAYAELFP